MKDSFVILYDNSKIIYKESPNTRIYIRETDYYQD